jgi:hypothetical protein
MDVKKKDGGLKDTEPDELFDQIALRDHAEKADHEQKRRDQVGEVRQYIYGFHGSLPIR